jgi:hypothetical protein
MADLTLYLAHSPTILLTHAAHGFLEPPPATAKTPFPSPDYLLVLRQGAVRDDLIRLAAARGVRGWFDPPLAILHELPRWLGSTERQPCGEFERVVLLSAALRRSATQIFARLRRSEDYVDAVDRLFGELIAEGVTPNGLQDGLDRNTSRDDFERQKHRELVAAYRDYVEALDSAGRRDGRDTWADCAAAVSSDPAKLAAMLGQRREIRLFGLADLHGGWRLLLRALGESPALDKISIYASHPLDLGDGLAMSTVRLDEPATVAERLFSGPREPSDRVNLITAPDVDRELGEVARRVRRLADDGTPLSQVAVITRQARPYVNLVIEALARFGVPATARRRTAYREIPVIRAVLSVFRAAAEGWTREALAEVAEQPFFANELDTGVINFLGFRRRLNGLGKWAEAIEELEQEATRQPDLEDEETTAPQPASHTPGNQLSLFTPTGTASAGPAQRSGKRAGAWTPPLDRISRAKRGLETFRKHADALSGERTLTEWLARLTTFLADDPWGIAERIYDVPADRFDLARLDLAGWQGLRQIVEEWRESVLLWGGGAERLSIAAFEARLGELLACDVAHWTETHRGVQVLEGMAAAYRSFDHVFIVGLEADRFPVRAPRSPILDEAERQGLVDAGLPLDDRATWEYRERELFRALVAAAGRELTLSHPRQDELGREVVRSAFIDGIADVATLDEATILASAILTPGLALYDTSRTLAQAQHAARIEVERNTGGPSLPSPYNGSIDDAELKTWLQQAFGDSRVWSATQIEEYARCPWAYFSKRLLRLERDEDPNEDMDNLVRGSVLHDALKRFYDAALEHTHGEPVFLGQFHASWAEPLLIQSLDAALTDAEEQTWIGHPALRQTKRRELRRMLLRFLRFEIDYNERMENNRTNNAKILRTGVTEHELPFEDIVLERDGIRFRFRGSIDRVEQGVDERVDATAFIAAVDYKTTKYAVPAAGELGGWDDGVVLQVPLYAYALTCLKPGSKVSRVEYRAVKNREVPHSLELVQVDRATKALSPNPAAVEKMERALTAVTRYVRRVRAGEFPASPAPSCMCPSYCHAWAICRVKGGPKTKWTW